MADDNQPSTWRSEADDSQPSARRSEADDSQPSARRSEADDSQPSARRSEADDSQPSARRNEAGSSRRRVLGFQRRSLLQDLQRILREYQDDGQIFKVSSVSLSPGSRLP